MQLLLLGQIAPLSQVSVKLPAPQDGTTQRPTSSQTCPAAHAGPQVPPQSSLPQRRSVQSGTKALTQPPL